MDIDAIRPKVKYTPLVKGQEPWVWSNLCLKCGKHPRLRNIRKGCMAPDAEFKGKHFSRDDINKVMEQKPKGWDSKSTTARVVSKEEGKHKDIVAKVMRRMEEKKDNNSSINNIGPAKTEQGFLEDL